MPVFRVLCSKSLPVLGELWMTGILFVAWDSAFFSMTNIGLIIIKRLWGTIGAGDFDAMGRGTKTDLSISDQAAEEGKILDLHTKLSQIFFCLKQTSCPIFPNFADLGMVYWQKCDIGCLESGMKPSHHEGHIWNFDRTRSCFVLYNQNSLVNSGNYNLKKI